jgi:hypothetical protein
MAALHHKPQHFPMFLPKIINNKLKKKKNAPAAGLEPETPQTQAFFTSPFTFPGPRPLGHTAGRDRSEVPIVQSIASWPT